MDWELKTWYSRKIDDGGSWKHNSRIKKIIVYYRWFNLWSKYKKVFLILIDMKFKNKKIIYKTKLKKSKVKQINTKKR